MNAFYNHSIMNRFIPHEYRDFIAKSMHHISSGEIDRISKT
jgi:hypothetical protein